LDELRIIPTGEAWHKDRRLTAAVHRLEMARLAFGAIDGVVVDPRETQRDGPSFTVDTLTELRREMPTAQLWLIIGKTRQQRCQDGTVGGRLPNLLQYV
jgi:nicotinate-nucleotide adenylyltransferase